MLLPLLLILQWRIWHASCDLFTLITSAAPWMFSSVSSRVSCVSWSAHSLVRSASCILIISTTFLSLSDNSRCFNACFNCGILKACGFIVCFFSVLIILTTSRLLTIESTYANSVRDRMSCFLNALYWFTTYLFRPKVVQTQHFLFKIGYRYFLTDLNVSVTKILGNKF